MRLLPFIVLTFFSVGIASNSFSQEKKTTRKPVRKTTTIRKAVPIKSIVRDIPGTRVLIQTDSGNMIVRLYDSTPLHRDNFIAKVNEGFYDSLLFHRVINKFMIQGGDPASRNAPSGIMLGAGSAPGERIPAEFHSAYIHKKGALAAARDNNPEMASSNCQFYLVQGEVYTDSMLNVRQVQTGRVFTPGERQVYKTLGGTPHLDQRYTVFGEVEAGLNVIDKIAGVPTALPGNRPLGDVHMSMQVLSEEAYKTMEKEMTPPKPRAPAKKVARKKTR
jgi:cyclophilin family peptidyl-prolyl cis-trans isomerase